MTTSLTTADVARALAISEWQVRKLIRTGKLAAIDISTGTMPRYRVQPSALERFRRSRRVAA